MTKRSHSLLTILLPGGAEPTSYVSGKGSKLFGQRSIMCGPLDIKLSKAQTEMHDQLLGCFYTPDGSVARTTLSSLIGGLCTQLGVRWLQRLDLRLDLPLERAAPLGELCLADHLEPALPVEQVAGNGAHLRLSLACFCALSKWQGLSRLAVRCSLLLGGLWLLFGVLWWRSLGGCPDRRQDEARAPTSIRPGGLLTWLQGNTRGASRSP